MFAKPFSQQVKAYTYLTQNCDMLKSSISDEGGDEVGKNEFLKFGPQVG